MVRIITDSVSDISAENIKEFGIDAVLPLTIFFGEQMYTDGVDLTKPAFYEKLAACTELPKTSQITPGEFLEQYNKYADDEIVVITLSSKLSGTYQSAVVAKETAGRADIYVIDSMNVTCGQGLLVMEAAKRRGRGLSGQEIAEAIEDMKGRVSLYAMLDTLKYLRMGGRLSATSAAVGSLLNIKPVICVEDGEVKAIGKARGEKNGREYLINKVASEEIDFDCEVIFAGSNCFEQVKSFAEEAAPKLGITDYHLMDIGMTVGVHIGENGRGIAYIRK